MSFELLLFVLAAFPAAAETCDGHAQSKAWP
jgi:hypothetical protein